MISRDYLTNLLLEIMGQPLLDLAQKNDELPNHIQLKGKPQVEKIALGVSCNQELLEKAISWGADYLIVHHGLYIAGDIYKGRFDPIEQRLKYIIKHDLSLAGFHYCLDAHPEIGNNAVLIKRLAARKLDETYFNGWGYVAEFPTPVIIEDLIARLEKICKHPVFAVKAGPKKVKRIGVCSGSAKPHGKDVLEIIDKKIDAIISGEISESGPATARDVGYHYLAAGHYATETFGVETLAKRLTDHLGIDAKVSFIRTDSSL